MKFRTWLNIITILFLALAIYLARHQIVQAWMLLGKVDLRIFLLMIPIQLFSYFAIGEVMFSYLRAKGDLKKMSRWTMARIALELNFINHIIPVPTIAGFSYLGWLLNYHDVSAGRATMAQIIRYVTMFISYLSLILISVVFLMFDRGVDRITIIISIVFTVTTIIAVGFLIYVIGNKQRMTVLSGWITKTINKFSSIFRPGKKYKALKLKKVDMFFMDLHQDYMEIQKDINILKLPVIWAIVGNILDTLLIFVAFLSFGYIVNPAVLFIAYGVSSFVAVFAATPGGSGVYEAIMITFLVSAGVPAGIAIAGTLLARVTLLAGTFIFGYIFYQLTINKYGKIEKPTSL
jgi:hypothetical protein